jgi:hypothetical protein
MRKAYEGGEGMSVFPRWGRRFRLSIAFIITCSTALAAITGQVTNQTTGKPQAGATVALYKLGAQNGLELIDQAKSDSQGQFTINREVQGPHLIRTAFDGVTYNHMLPPGRPTTGLTLDVFNASRQPGAAKVGKHMILFEPGGRQVTVSETYLFTNTGKTAWNDPDVGTLRFFLPEGAGGKVEVQGTAPGGMPLGAPVKKTAKADIYAVDFPVKPGETRFHVSYTVPYTEGEAYAGKVVTKDENTYLVVPSGVTLKGDNLNDLGMEPRSQAHIFGLSGNSYSVQLTGAVAPVATDAGGDADGTPKIEQIMPRVLGQVKLIVALALGILALGFALLYRASGTPDVLVKESRERARR